MHFTAINTQSGPSVHQRFCITILHGTRCPAINQISCLIFSYALSTGSPKMKSLLQQVRVKKFVPNKKGDIGMEVYYLCQPNTYVISRDLVSSSDGNDIGVGLT